MCSLEQQANDKRSAELEANKRKPIMTTQDIANEFMASYTEASWVYGRIADEVLYIMGNAKTCNINAYEYLDLDVDSRELWIVNNVLPVLQNKGWPKHGSKDFHLSVQDVCHNVLFPSEG